MPQAYVLDRTPEIDRLEQQAHLIGHDRVTDHFHVGPGGAVLDAGSGTGWASRLMAETAPEVRVTGIDITPQFVDHATQAATKAHLSNLTYRVADICNLPFDAKTFDLVWSQLVVFFLPHPEKAIAEFARVLRPGGQVKVIVTDGVFEDIWPQNAALSDGLRAMRDQILHGWRLALVPEMLRAAGLQDITMQSDIDRVYSFIGGASPAQRRNIEKSYLHAIRSNPQMTGGMEQAEQLATRLEAFISNPESTAISRHWTFTATKP